MLLTIVIVSIIVVLLLLAYSLHSQYNYLSRSVFTSYNESLNSAVNKYRSFRFDRISVPGNRSMTVEYSDFDTRGDSIQGLTIDEITYLINGRLLAQTPFELHKLDSIFSSELKEKEIESIYNINVFKHQSDSILEQSNANAKLSYRFHTARKELDSTRDVQIDFLNPVWLILRKMALSFLFSFTMLIMIIMVLVYQSRIIAKQKKIETIRQDFIDSMTHELRHPLQGALSLSEILNNDKIAGNNSMRNNMMERLRANLQNIEQLLHSLVIQSYSENLQTTAHWQQGNLKNAIDEIISTCSLTNTKLVHFNTNYSDEIANCRFDAVHFPNAIKNLIENAIKYSNGEVVIDIRATMNNNFIEVAVADNGTGISEEDMPHIFEKFYRGNINKRSHSFGLGLSYVKWVSDIHNGRVTVESTQGEGSVFTLIIPNSIVDGDH